MEICSCKARGLWVWYGRLEEGNMQNLAREDRKLDEGDGQTEKDTDILNGKRKIKEL